MNSPMALGVASYKLPSPMTYDIQLKRAEPPEDAEDEEDEE